MEQDSKKVYQNEPLCNPCEEGVGPCWPGEYHGYHIRAFVFPDSCGLFSGEQTDNTGTFNQCGNLGSEPYGYCLPAF